MVEPVENVAETLVHSLDERGVGSLFLGESFAQVFGKVAGIAVDGNVNGVVRHVEIERLVVAFGLVERRDGLASQGFGEEDARVPILLKSRYGHLMLLFRVGSVAETAFAEIGGWPSTCVSCDVYLKAPVRRILARRVFGAPMCLATVYGMVARRLQKVDERDGFVGVSAAIDAADTVVVPVGERQAIVTKVSRFVLFQRPVGHPMPCGVAPRHQTATARRANGAGISLCEHHALGRQAFHVGRFVAVVIEGALVPKGE